MRCHIMVYYTCRDCIYSCVLRNYGRTTEPVLCCYVAGYAVAEKNYTHTQ